MMASTSRPHPARAFLAFAALLAAGCQDYNFNPVGHCLIAPARERYPLSDISTADVLFVVDDSGSMKFEQEQLGAGFEAFIQNLDATNAERVAGGNDPIDFHIAVTTTSVFYNDEISSAAVVCRSDCPGGGASPVCCEMTSTQGGLTPARPYLGYQKCDAASECGGLDCRSDCQGLLGEKYCCDPTTKLLPLPNTPVACQAVGAECGAMQTHFRFDGACVHGNATQGAPYPQGAFVGFGNNPRVLHFDKELYPEPGEPRDPALPACPTGAAACNRQGFTADQLKGWFAREVDGTWQGNVIAGTCGSGQEQALQAAKLALEKALQKKQLDTFNARGVAESVTAAWPHANSKLVLVFVGDEDDCSSPVDPSRGVVMRASGGPGDDACTNDASGAKRQQQVADFVSYFTGLGRPVAAAFIVSTAQSACVDAGCSAGICCPLVDQDDPSSFVCRDRSNQPSCNSTTCGGQAAGVRLLDAASKLGAAPTEPPPEIVRASVCDSQFSNILNRVAEIVKPPPGLSLPTRPASPEITVVRIARKDGTTRKTCRGPAPATLTAEAATAAGWDWWFTASRGDTAPVSVSKFVYINHDTGSCEANPGETYSADFVGLVPDGGCQTTQECFDQFGGNTSPRAWSCYAGGSQATTWVRPTTDNPGTCVCGDVGLDSAGNESDYSNVL